MKYIMFKAMADGDEYPVIFPGHLNHSDVAKAVERQFRATPVSAGFIQDLVIREAYGESNTLKLKSRGGKDTSEINLFGRVWP